MSASTVPRVGFTDEADDRGGAHWEDVVRFEAEQRLAQLTARPIVREIELG